MPSNDALTIPFYPALADDEEFIDHYYRMVWFPNPLREKTRRIVTPYEGEAPSVGLLPYYLDRTIKQTESGIVDAVHPVSLGDANVLERVPRESGIVRVWPVGGKTHL